MKNISRLFVVLFAVFVLAACQTTKKNQFNQQNFQITQVDVTVQPHPEDKKLSKPTETFPDKISNAIKNHVAEYNSTRPNATASYRLDVSIDKVHFKNPVASLLVGDANRIQGTAKLIDTLNGNVVHTAPANYFDGASGALNGVSGAVLSVLVKREAAEETMSKGVAKNLMKIIYPDVKLPSSSQDRLRGKAAFAPRTTAISSLSSPQVLQLENAPANGPNVVTLSQ